MVYTLTLNPSLDYVLHLSDFQEGRVNRSLDETIFPGGKGINVSIMLEHLGVPNRCLGFYAGFTGEKLIALLKKQGCNPDFIQVKEGFTRINVKLKAPIETEINGNGAAPAKDELDGMLEKCRRLQEGDVLVLAGSVPTTFPSDIYQTILKESAGKGVKTVVDATGELLYKSIEYHPFLVKPNQHELGELFHVCLKDEEQIILYAQKLKDLGAQNVLVSRAGEGAVLVDEYGYVHQSAPPKGELINSVGSGDSMVAGFLAGYLENDDYQKAFCMGLAAGSASAFSEWLAEKSLVDMLFHRLMS